jgi:hypothetical protein
LPDLVDQLRRYGEAVEAEAVRVTQRDPVVVDRPWWRRPGVLAAAAAALLVVVAVGATTMRLARTDDDHVVRTVPATTPDGAPSTTAAPDASSTTTAGPDGGGDAGGSTTTAPGAAPTATTTVRPSLLVPPPTTTSTTSAGATTTSTPSEATTTTVVPPTSLHGTATWTGGRDPRGALLVAACPVAEQPGCASWRLTEAASDGSFELLLPKQDSPRDWKVVAAAVVDGEFSRACVFGCTWRSVVIGPPTTISDANPPESLNLSVAARVVDVYVRDRNNQPFDEGGLMVTDTRCPQAPCPDGQAPLFRQVSPTPTDGLTRIVVDPAAMYDLTGMAFNQPWPNPQFTRSDGTTSWHSPTVQYKGSAIPESLVLRVNGGPA